MNRDAAAGLASLFFLRGKIAVMKFLIAILLLASLGCGPAMDANNMVRNTNSGNSNTSPSPTPDISPTLAAIASESQGKVGVHAVLIETGETVSHSSADSFAMQSVVKLPISMAVLKMVEEGKLTLDEQIAFTKAEILPGNMRSPIREKFPNGGELPVRDLIRHAMVESDGTAADVLQRIAGGAAGVQKFVDGLGVQGMKIVHSHMEFSKVWERQYENAVTPEAATALLIAFHRSTTAGRGSGEISETSMPPLRADLADMLLGFMLETPTGPNRLKGELPQGTQVAHKTGTGGSRDGVTFATNDAGVIKLPDGRHIAIAVFVGDSRGDETTRERAIARSAKAVFDRFNR